MNPTIEDRAKSLGEPEAIVRFRERMERAAIDASDGGDLRYGIKIGTSIAALRGGYQARPEYAVKGASKPIEIYTWKEAMLDDDTSGIAAQALLRAGALEGVPHLFASTLARYTDGLLVYVQPELGPLGEIVETSVDLATRVEEDAADVVVIYVKTGARVVVTDRVSAKAGTEFGRTMIVLAEDDSSVSLCADRRQMAGATLIERRAIFAGEHAAVDVREVYASAALAKADTEILLEGDGSAAELRSVGMLDGSSRADLYHVVRHGGSETRSRVRAAALVGSEGRLVHRGLIDMASGVRDVDGEEDARFFTAGEKAVVDAIPSLDIATDSVRSAHRLAIVHLSEKELFYPETRGFSPEDARSLIVGGALASAFGEGIPAAEEIGKWIDAESGAIMARYV